MSDRTVKYTFTGSFTNLTAGLAASGKAVGDLGTKMTALDKNGAKMRAGLTTIGTSAGKMGLVAAAGLAAVVGVTARFEKAMSSVQAATHETTGNMELLRAAAIKAGADTAYSASEAAGAIEELAKAGVSTRDILGGGLAGSLNLAAAGGIEVADAAELAATALTQFSLSGSDVNHVADLLAAGAGKAQGSVDDLGMALKQSGLVAAQTGLSIEETTGTLAAFASAGLIGSDAGTSFKTMLQSLTPSGDKAASAMERLGITAYDAQGNFVGMTEFAGNLRNGLKDLSVEQQNAALKTIFGSDAVRAAAVIYDQGAKGIQGWIDKTNDAGYAAETAATRLDNLAGDWEQFTGSLETALIGAGSGSQGALRDIVQGATDAVNAFNDLPPAVQGTTTKLLGLTAVTGGALWFGSKVITGISSTKEALGNLGIQAGTTRKALLSIGKGVEFAAIGLAVTLLTDQIEDLGNTSLEGDLNRNLEALANGNIVGNLGNMGKYLRDINSSMDHAQQNAFGWVPFADTSWKKAEQEIGDVDEALAQMVEGGNAEQAAAVMGRITDMAAEQGISVQEATKWFDQYNLALSNLGGSSIGQILDDITGGALSAAGATKQFVGPTRESADALKDETQALRDSISAMRDKRDATLGAFDAETQWGQAVIAAREAAAKGKRGINELTAAGQENRSALSALASAWNNQSSAVQNADGKFKNARQTFINTATAMGVPQAAAKKLADTMLEIPSQKLIKIKAETAAAQAALERIQAFKLLDKFVTVHTLHDSGDGVSYQHGDIGADGTTVPKTGRPYADRHPYMLADGEEVVSNRHGQADRNRGLLKAINANRLADGGTTGGFSLSTYARSSADHAATSLDKLARAGDKATVAFEWVSGGLRGELLVRQKLLQNEVDRDKQRLDMLKQERQALADSIAARFSASPFGQSNGSAPTLADTSGMSAEDRAAAIATYNQQLAAYSQANSPTAILQQQLADAREMRDLLKQLQQMGLSGPALAQVATTASLEEMRALIAGGRGAIAQYEHLLGAVGNVSSQLGSSIGNSVYGQDIKDQTKELREHTKALHRVEHRLDKLEKSNSSGHNQTKVAVERLGGKVGNAKRER